MKPYPPTGPFAPPWLGLASSNEAGAPSSPVATKVVMLGSAINHLQSSIPAGQHAHVTRRVNCCVRHSTLSGQFPHRLSVPQRRVFKSNFVRCGFALLSLSETILYFRADIAGSLDDKLLHSAVKHGRRLELPSSAFIDESALRARRCKSVRVHFSLDALHPRITDVQTQVAANRQHVSRNSRRSG
jgi:hypothetical protein